MLRVLLIAVLIHGLVPSAGELVEAVVHLAQTGHIAHDAQHHDEEGSSPSEHGCGPTAHRCGCCVNQPVLARSGAPLEQGASSVTLLQWQERSSAPEGVRAPPFRPPIES